jgi:predicted RNase H-like nuclease (RuvC/YqgF family)
MLPDWNSKFDEDFVQELIGYVQRMKQHVVSMMEIEKDQLKAEASELIDCNRDLVLRCESSDREKEALVLEVSKLKENIQQLEVKREASVKKNQKLKEEFDSWKILTSEISAEKQHLARECDMLNENKKTIETLEVELKDALRQRDDNKKLVNRLFVKLGMKMLENDSMDETNDSTNVSCELSKSEETLDR